MTQLRLAPLTRLVAASSCGFRSGLGGKIAVALVVCLGVRALLAQAPAAPAASKFVAAVEEDAQGYKVLKPHANYYGDAKKRSEYNKLKREKVAPVLTGQKSLTEGRAAFDGFYERIFFPIMTQTSEDALRTISDSRRDLQRDLDQSGAKAADVHTHLIRLSLSTLTNIVRDNFHPAVRYNAMLIISGLNDQEGGTSSKSTAVPMASALPVILEEFKRPENPDAVKVAALLGLMWHLEGENAKSPTAQPNPLKAEVIKELLAFVETKDPPEGRSSDGHTWMRRRAIDALTVACQSKTDPTIVAALDKLVRDDSQPIAIRCAVAQSLGKVSLQPPTAVDVPALAKELGHVALQACEDELTRAIKQRKDEDERLARQMGTYSGEMAGGMSGDGGGMPGGGMPGGGYTGAGGGTYTGAQVYAGPRAAVGSTPGGMPGDGGTGGYGTEMSVDPSLLDPKSYRFDLIRRKIRQGLYCVQIGLLGGEDHQRPKTGASAAASSKAPPPSAKEAEKRGLFGVAKANEKQMVNDIYYEVRDLIDVLENRATDTFMLDREMRKKMKNLENLIGKRAVTTPSGAPDEDVPGAVSAVAKPAAGKAVAGKANGAKGGKRGPAAAKPGGGKALPGKPAPARPVPTKTVPAPGKSAWRRPGGFAPPSVHGSVRR